MQKSSTFRMICTISLTALLAAACSSSSGSSSSGSSSSGSSSSGSSSSADSAVVSKANAAVASDFKSPVSIGVTTPLSKTPPTNVTVDVITNTLTVGLLLGTAARMPEAPGWHVNVMTMNSTPEGVLSVLQQAINRSQRPSSLTASPAQSSSRYFRRRPPITSR